MTICFVTDSLRHMVCRADMLQAVYGRLPSGSMLSVQQPHHATVPVNKIGSVPMTCIAYGEAPTRLLGSPPGLSLLQAAYQSRTSQAGLSSTAQVWSLHFRHACDPRPRA